MSYTPPARKRYKVTVERLGLEIAVEGSSVEEMQAFHRANQYMVENGRPEIVGLAALMAPRMLSWNDPRPCDLTTLLTYDWPDLYAILMEYATAVSGVAAPLDAPSIDGERSAEESTLMEQSLASLSS